MKASAQILIPTLFRREYSEITVPISLPTVGGHMALQLACIRAESNASGGAV
jgi:hypothetical protein